MRKTLIAAAIAALGAGAYTAFAQPTLDVSPNRVWRNAPESTSVEKEPEPADRKRGPMPTYEQEQPFVFYPPG